MHSGNPVQVLEVEINGVKLNVCSGRNDSFWLDYSHGEWERDTFVVFEKFIDPNHSYIDMGAWIGPTLFFGCQLAQRAFGIEPDPIAFAELSSNMRLNLPRTSNVEISNVCIAPNTGKVSFGNRGDGGDSMSSLLFGNGKTGWMIDGVSFNQWVKDKGAEDSSFIKIDIEGGEYEVLPTMSSYLKQHRPTVHLSLHPSFLGNMTAQRPVEKTLRRWLRLRKTVRLLTAIKHYKYLYEPMGKLVPASAGIRYRLASIDSKPLRMLMACVYSMFGRQSVLVATDSKWKINQRSSKSSFRL